MINRIEAIGIAVSIGVMVLALYLIRVEQTNDTLTALERAGSQEAALIVGNESPGALVGALAEGISESGEVKRLIIDDVVIGEGVSVEAGDRVTVHYIGTLQNGQQFDNSYVKGAPFTFTVGAGRVIEGWDKGLLGMQAGGQRILVVPSDLAYGQAGQGPIPGGASLVFAIELLSIDN